MPEFSEKQLDDLKEKMSVALYLLPDSDLKLRILGFLKQYHTEVEDILLKYKHSQFNKDSTIAELHDDIADIKMLNDDLLEALEEDAEEDAEEEDDPDFYDVWQQLEDDSEENDSEEET